MALEINEINIQMQVGERSDDAQSGAYSGRAKTAKTAKPDKCSQEAMVTECTRRVLQRLQQLQVR